MYMFNFFVPNVHSLMVKMAPIKEKMLNLYYFRDLLKGQPNTTFFNTIVKDNKNTFMKYIQKNYIGNLRTDKIFPSPLLLRLVPDLEYGLSLLVSK